MARQFRIKEQVLEILAEQKMAMEAKEREKRSEVKYRARRWTEMYPLIGLRPVLSTESEQAIRICSPPLANCCSPKTSWRRSL